MRAVAFLTHVGLVFVPEIWLYIVATRSCSCWRVPGSCACQSCAERYPLPYSGGKVFDITSSCPCTCHVYCAKCRCRVHLVVTVYSHTCTLPTNIHLTRTFQLSAHIDGQPDSGCSCTFGQTDTVTMCTSFVCRAETKGQVEGCQPYLP